MIAKTMVIACPKNVFVHDMYYVVYTYLLDSSPYDVELVFIK